jgi:hypothetical protein
MSETLSRSGWGFCISGISPSDIALAHFEECGDFLEKSPRDGKGSGVHLKEKCLCSGEWFRLHAARKNDRGFHKRRNEWAA